MAELKRILVNEILPSDDRIEGGFGDIKKLSQSIKMVGLINPITVREIQDKEYRYVVVAGRRRLAAICVLELKEVDAVIYGENEEIPDEEIALAENVNRLDLHPLDEGVKYKGLISSGKNIEDLSKTYDRSQAHIYQRMKLCDLSAGLKGIFRAGGITITQAAKIASVPEEVQQKIFEAIKEKNERNPAFYWHINDIIDKSIKRRLFFYCKKCDTCPKRTWYSNNNLFPEFDNAEDYCFDGKCYKKEIKNAAIQDIKIFLKRTSHAKKVLIYFYDGKIRDILTEIKKVDNCNVEVFNDDVYTVLDAEEEKDLPKEAAEQMIPIINVLTFDKDVQFALKTEEYDKYFSGVKTETEDRFKEERILIERLPEEYREEAYKDLKRYTFLTYDERDKLRVKTFIELLKMKGEPLAKYFCLTHVSEKLLKRFHNLALIAFELVTGNKTSQETFIKDMSGISNSLNRDVYAYTNFLYLLFSEIFNQKTFIETFSKVFEYTEDRIEGVYQQSAVDFLSERYKEKTGIAPEDVIDIEPFRSGN